jgi:hypothetical protein
MSQGCLFVLLVLDQSQDAGHWIDAATHLEGSDHARSVLQSLISQAPKC